MTQPIPGIELVNPLADVQDDQLVGLEGAIQHGLQQDAIRANPEQLGPTGLERADARVAQAQQKWGGDPIEVAYTQATRGLIDAIVAPGALVGAAAEAAGAASGSDWLSDFGRGLGRSSSGQETMALAAELMGDDEVMAPGTSKQTASAAFKSNLRKQEEAWPLLSQVSRLAGQLTFAVAGSAAGGATSAGKLALLGAFEGMEGGAQAAYEHNAPLTDVLSSVMLGGALGGAAGYGGGKLGEWGSRNMPKFGELAESVGKEAARQGRNAYATVDELGGVQAKKVFDTIMGAKDDIAKSVRAAGPNATAREVAESAARGDIAQKLASKVKGDVASWSAREPDAVTKFVRRSEYLDQISADLSQDVAATAAARPALDFDLDIGAVKKLMDDADGALAMGTVKSRISSAMSGLPPTAEADAFGVALREAAQNIEMGGLKKAGRSMRHTYKDGAAVAMQEGHNLVRASEALINSGDEATRAFGQRIRTELTDDLSSEAFGTGGKVYGRSQVLTDPLAELADPKVLRERLKSLEMQGELLGELDKRNRIWEDAFSARKALSKENTPKGSKAAIDLLTKRVAAAERVLTLDGKSTGRVIDLIESGAAKLGAEATSGSTTRAATWVQDKLMGMAKDKLLGVVAGAGMGGGIPGMALGYMVSNYVAPMIGKSLTPLISKAGRRAVAESVLPVAAKLGGSLAQGHVATAHEAYDKTHDKPAATAQKREPLLIPDRQKRYRERIDQLNEFSDEQSADLAMQGMTYMHEAPPELTQQVAAEMNAKVGRLMQEIPKPKPHIGGAAYEVLSVQDLKRSEAMWDATFEPMGMFEQFDKGTVNYDRIEYTWKQYPGLKQAVQAGITDVLNAQLSGDQRARIPANVLTQWDYLGGFNGELQQMNSPQFSANVSELFAEAEKKDQQKRQNAPPPSKSPMAAHQRTYSQKLMK